MADEERAPPARRGFVTQLASIGPSAQAAIPGLYAWAVTVAPLAWGRGGSWAGKAASLAGVLALVTAPLAERAVERAADRAGAERDDRPPGRWSGASPGRAGARLWSVWGFVASSSLVWVLMPGALSSARFDPVRGVLGVIGWALFAFASAGPSLERDQEASSRSVAGQTLRPRSEVPRGDIVYVLAGVVLALAMQAVGWGIAVPERAVLVRLVTVTCGIAVLGATTSIALARHGPRLAASRSLRLRRALPWVVLLALLLVSSVVLSSTR